MSILKLLIMVVGVVFIGCSSGSSSSDRNSSEILTETEVFDVNNSVQEGTSIGKVTIPSRTNDQVDTIELVGRGSEKFMVTKDGTINTNKTFSKFSYKIVQTEITYNFQVKIVYLSGDIVLINIQITVYSYREVADIDKTPPTKPVLTTTPTDTNNNSERVEINGEVGAIVLVNDIEKGVINSNGKITITLDTSGVDGEKIFSIILKDSSGNRSEALIVTIKKITPLPIDTTKPVITLIGNSIVNIVQGAIYNDAGATALDDIDGNISSNITIINPVDTSIIASYTVMYDVNDTAGNQAVRVSRVVNVIAPVVEDKIKPIITLLGNPVVNIVQGSTYSDVGATALDNIDGNISSNIIIDNPVDTSIITSYTVMYDVNDTAGNQAISVSRVVNVIVPPTIGDKTKPIIKLLGNPIINIVQGSTYSDVGATAFDNIDGNISSDIVITNPVNTSIVASYTVTYDVNDTAGNQAVRVSRVVNVIAPPVVEDKIKPIITLLGNPTVNIVQGSTYSDAGATALDDIDGNISSNIVILNNVNINSVGTYTITYNVKDSANNQAIEVIRTINVSTAPNTTPPQQTPPTITGTAKISTNVYAKYQFLPTATDINGDTLSFTIENKPTWANFNPLTGLLFGNPLLEGSHENIIISVSDGTETVSLAPFNIMVTSAINIAHKFGVATQSADSSYQYYEDPANVIDNNLNTMNMTADAGWLQVALPKGTKVAKVVIRNRTDAWSNRLSGTKVYIGTTAFNGTIIEGDYIGTLTDSSAPQIFNFETFKEGDYVLLKENDDNLHVLEVEVYGETPVAPVWKSVNSTLGLKAHASVSTVVGKVEALDYQSDVLSYTIVGDVPFSVDAQGVIHLTQTINHNIKQSYSFQVEASDGVNKITTDVNVKLLGQNGVKQERWNGISGSSVNDFLTHAHYQDAPDETKVVLGLDMNTNLTNDFGQKMTTLFKPEESGTYIFAIVGDDGTELRLDGEKIAYKAGWAGYQDWNVAGKSNEIYLEAGHIYSIDAFLKEGSGGEHISVGIKKNAESDFSLIPENQLFLEVLNSETVKPIFVNGETVLRVPSDLSSGENVGSIIVKDYQDDPISYSIEESNLPFTIDLNGNIHSTGTLENNHTYRFHVSVSDGSSNVSSWVTVVTDKNEKDYYTEMLDYSSEYTITNNMQGDLAGQLWFMQSQMHRPKAKEGEFRPLAVAFRSALLLFMMEDATSIHAMEMKVTNEKGEVYKAQLSKPSKLGLCDQSTTDSRAKLTFSKRSWTGEIPWNFMTPKMSIELTELDSSGTEQKSASLNAGEIKLGTPHELVINNIDLGMLVEPRGENEHVYSKYNKTAEYALNYFQTAPIAKYTVGRYAPAYFPKVVLDDGTVYTDKSASTDAGVYSGDMRWTIAKALVSTGINKANIGLISDKSQDDDHDRIIRQTLLHTAQGKYTNPDTGEAVTVVHGLSGGAGKLTLIGVAGNEFSHEYGHDHGMGHYPGGIYAIHNYESGWSYNTYLNRFIGNLRWKSSASSVSNPNTEESVAPFKNLYSYGKDSMGSGNPNESLFSKFTFYTPYTAYYIQRNLAQSGMIDDSSLTGYSQWNSEEEQYEPKSVIYPKPTQTKIPVMTLLGFYDPEKSLTTFIYPALYSNYGSYFSSEVLNARTTDDTCKIVVTRGDNTEESYNLLSTRKVSTRMNQFQLNLPLSGNYKKAKIVCDNTELDSRDIVASTFNLKEPVIIGKEYGMKMALKQMRLFSEVFGNTNFATNKKFVEVFNTHYASLKSYTDGVKVEEGDSFVLGTKYFIALADNLDAPNETSENWLYLGNSQSYIHLEKLAFGKASENFTERFGSSMYFLVPVDNERVLASNALSGEWYSTNTTQITVQAINKSTGEKQAIVIGGTVRGAPVQGGNNYDVSSVLKFFFKKEDNPTLAKGEYAVSFYTTGRRWHASDVTLHLLVEGSVVVE